MLFRSKDTPPWSRIFSTHPAIRDEETFNPKIPTGTIEFEVHKVTILGRVYKQLPFEIMTSKETREDAQRIGVWISKNPISVIFRRRNEDARADRSPGEFYQLDFEMSFATQEDVFRIGEEVLTETFAKFAPEGYEVTQAPYPIISYKQAMLEFGSDKPDLRNPLRIIDLSEFFNKCTFKPFQNKTVRAINVHAKLSKGQHEKLLKFATGIGMGGLGYLEVLEDGSYKGPIDKFIPEELKGEIKDLAGLQPGDTISNCLYCCGACGRA